jgi:hypothetical protein
VTRPRAAAAAAGRIRPMKSSLPKALLLVTLLARAGPCAAQTPARADEGRRVKALAKVMDAGTYAEVNKAILDLSWPRSGEAAEFLLKRLRRNLSRKRGNREEPYVSTGGSLTEWGIYPSENELLVRALEKQGHAAAAPTLRRMLRMGRERSGVSAHNLAFYIHQLTGETVEYEEGGEKRRFPDPAPGP